MLNARSHRFIYTAAILAGAIALVLPSIGTAGVTGHLYVATGPFQLWRFPLVDGIPAQLPDLKIPNTGNLVAVRSDGVVVAQVGSLPKIAFYAPGQTKPERTLNIRPSKAGCPIRLASIAVDAQNDLYVARSIPDPCNLDDIAVYDPNASGNADPIATVKAAAGEIAVDPGNGDLFDSVIVLNQAANIYSFSSLSHGLKPLHSFVGAAQTPQQMTIRADSDFHTIWIYTTPGGYGANSIVGYYTASNGFTFPISGLFPNQADVASTGAVVFWHGFFYSTFGGVNGQGVYTYHSNRFPDATVHLQGCCPDHIAVGP